MTTPCLIENSAACHNIEKANLAKDSVSYISLVSISLNPVSLEYVAPVVYPSLVLHEKIVSLSAFHSNVL